MKIKKQNKVCRLNLKRNPFQGVLMSSLLLSHSCLSGRVGSMTNCVSVRPSWSSSAKRTYSRTTLMSWTTLVKSSSSWWTSTVQPRGLTTFPGAHKNSEWTYRSCISAKTQSMYIHSSFILTQFTSLIHRCPKINRYSALAASLKIYLLAFYSM